MLKFCCVYFYTSNFSLLPPNCFLFSLYQKTDNVSCRIFDITARKIGGGGVSGFFYNIYKERRKGRRIKGSSEKENFDPDDIKQKMVGREIKGHYYRVDNDGYSDEVVLKADCITTMERLLCFDLELHKQEILGIGGLSDCGMVFSLANKNARESAWTQEYSA